MIAGFNGVELKTGEGIGGDRLPVSVSPRSQKQRQTAKDGCGSGEETNDCLHGYPFEALAQSHPGIGAVSQTQRELAAVTLRVDDSYPTRLL
jgi:hypothetical protein